MRTVSQLTASLTPYLAVGSRSYGTSVIGMLNIVQPRLLEMGHWKSTLVEVEFDCTAGYVTLSPDYESIVHALVQDVPVPIQGMEYEYLSNGPGIVEAGSSGMFGIIDEGYVSLLSDPPDGGIESLIFTSTAAFASGDTATVTYTDSEDGYTQVALPLYLTMTVTAAADGTAQEAGTTILTVANTAGLVVGMGINLASDDAGDDEYETSTWRVTNVTNATTFRINKTWTNALVDTSVALTSAATLIPANTITSVESIVYTSLPARTVVKDADDVLYAVLLAGDGVAQYRRYQVPQPPEDASDTWTLKCLCKRAWIPVTSTSDLVYLDNFNVLRHAFLAVVAEDASDMDKAGRHWAAVKKILSEELAESRGGVRNYPSFNPWGDGVPALLSYY